MRKLFRHRNDFEYRLMIGIFWVMDLFGRPDKRLNDFSIQPGEVVVDVGCGPGRYLRRASELVGPAGRVYALDLHPIAIKSVTAKIEKHGLDNVVPVPADSQERAIPAQCADVIYALDMFHQVDDAAAFLAGIHRIAKPSAVLYLEDGHQPRERTLIDVGRSPLWTVSANRRKHTVLTPA